MHGNNSLPLPKCYSQGEIPIDNCPLPRALSEMPCLQEAINEMHEFMPDVTVGLLVGSNCPRALQPLKVIPNAGEGPFAVKYMHGWSINGPVEVLCSNNRVICNRVSVNELRVKETLKSDVLDILNQDFKDLCDPSALYDAGLSQEDRQFLSIVEPHTQHVNGHFVMPLPFRNPDFRFPFNRNFAFRRLESQRRKMLRDQKYHDDYTAFVDALLKQGYAERIADNDVNDDTWYLPHHGVYHPQKKKVRVVYDCSASYRGTSLNDQLLQGPDLANSLVGVLCRFREHPVAFIGDIESMFYQVQVPKDQRRFLRFLWWPGGDLNAPLAEYQMNVHLFGASSSPSIANLALRKTGELAEGQFGRDVAKVIRENFYVDDCLKSVKSDDDAVQLVHSLKDACRLGGFNLTKFCSNSKRVVESLPLQERSKELQVRSLGESLPPERVLGVHWDVENDLLGFKLGEQQRHANPMRRTILTAVASISDPIGILAPFVLKAKQILQTLCKLPGLGWDDQIPPDLREQWTQWQDQLPTLTTLTIERCIEPKHRVDASLSREIHVFADASNQGYGVVAFMRLASSTEQFVHCEFLVGKSRVAPHKSTTTPRLELTAASVATRLGHAMSRELHVDRQC